MDTTCIMCSIGCPLTVEEQDNKILVVGNGCPRGAEYGAKAYAALAPRQGDPRGRGDKGCGSDPHRRI